LSFLLEMYLGVNKYTTNMAIYGETGSYPLYTNVLKSMLSFWLHVLKAPTNSLLYAAYKTDLDLINKGNNSTWAYGFKKIMKYFGFEHVWINQSTLNEKKLIYAFYNVIKNKFINFWQNDISNSAKLRTYVKFKNTFETESYLKSTKMFYIRRLITKFRVSNHRLEIELGRYTKPSTPVEERLCKICNENKTEDEFHCIIECTALDWARNLMLKSVDTMNINPNDLFIHIMKCNSKCITEALYKFLDNRFNIPIGHMYLTRGIIYLNNLSLFCIL